MDFDTWKTGPAADVLWRAFHFDVSRCASWDHYTRALLQHRKELGGSEAFVERARMWGCRFSSGERVLFLACLHAADYGWLADELADGRFLGAVWSAGLDSDFALALGATMARLDWVEPRALD